MRYCVTMGAGLPQMAQLPRWPTSWDDPVAVRAWGEGLQVSIARLYLVVSFALNSVVDAAVVANRPASPSYNGALFYATDTNHLYVGSAGTWIEVT